jgi:precorrin-6A/cobalt-precorrin-6A reductase
MPTIVSHFAVASAGRSFLDDAMTAPHILILGGTSEARQLAERLDRRGTVRLTLSLAGRTATPLKQAGEVRTGGFGGADGLASWLRDNKVDVLVDATHPFATQISANARAAAEATGVKFIVLEREAWQRVTGDRWIEVTSIEDAVAALGGQPRTVFLAIGRQELGAFCRAPQHKYVVRSVDPVGADSELPHADYILDRGPFDEAAEHRLLRERGIDLVVAKNSGGNATYGKLAAARALGLPVVMVQRRHARNANAVGTVDEAIAAIDHAVGLVEERGE